MRGGEKKKPHGGSETRKLQRKPTHFLGGGKLGNRGVRDGGGGAVLVQKVP